MHIPKIDNFTLKCKNSHKVLEDCFEISCVFKTMTFVSQSQLPDTPMSSASDATKQELNAGLQMSITPQTTTTHTRSKPQACKVCGKILSSASSYYVHMKLHSGTKPFACTVSMYSQSKICYSFSMCVFLNACFVGNLLIYSFSNGAHWHF